MPVLLENDAVQSNRMLLTFSTRIYGIYNNDADSKHFWNVATRLPRVLFQETAIFVVLRRTERG